jgi:hypothetical protein
MDTETIKGRVKSVLEAFDGDTAVERIMDLVDEVQHVPGQYRCAICGLSLTENVISMSRGQIGARVNAPPQVCANGCGMMDRVTWKQWSESQAKGADRMLAWKETLDVGLQGLVNAVEDVVDRPPHALRNAEMRKKVEEARKVMGANLSDDLVRIVHEYWQLLFNGASPKDLRVVEGK